MCDWVTRMVRFVVLRLKRRAVRWWSCSRDIFVQLNVSLVWNWCLVRSWRSFWVRVILSQVNTLWLWLYTTCVIVWLGDSNGTVRHVEIEAKSSALVEMLKRHVRTIERITDMKLMSRSIMMIILSSSIFLLSQHSVAVTVYHEVMYDCVTRMVRFVMLRMKRRAVRWWRCLRNIFVQLNVLLIWNWCLVRTWRSFCVRVFLSQVNNLWLWLCTMWSCIIGWLEWYGSSRWDWNEEQCVGGVA